MRIWATYDFCKNIERVKMTTLSKYFMFGKYSSLDTNARGACISSLQLYNKKNITRRFEDMNFIFSWRKQYFTHSLRSFVKYCFHHSKIKFISSHCRVISSISIFISTHQYQITDHEIHCNKINAIPNGVTMLETAIIIREMIN